MATRTWTGSNNDGDVANAANWSALPGAGDTAVIPTGITGPALYPTKGIMPAAFNGATTVNSGGEILGGTWPATAGTLTVSDATNGIKGGTFNCLVVANSGTIRGGMFNAAVTCSGALISGGTFNSTVSMTDTVVNQDTSTPVFKGDVTVTDPGLTSIQGGTYNGKVTLAAATTIQGGTFNGGLTLSESLIGAVINSQIATNDSVKLFVSGQAVASIGPWPVTSKAVGPFEITLTSLGPYPVH